MSLFCLPKKVTKKRQPPTKQPVGGGGSLIGLLWYCGEDQWYFMHILFWAVDGWGLGALDDVKGKRSCLPAKAGMKRIFMISADDLGGVM